MTPFHVYSHSKANYTQFINRRLVQLVLICLYRLYHTLSLSQNKTFINNQIQKKTLTENGVNSNKGTTIRRCFFEFSYGYHIFFIRYPVWFRESALLYFPYTLHYPILPQQLLFSHRIYSIVIYPADHHHR